MTSQPYVGLKHHALDVIHNSAFPGVRIQQNLGPNVCRCRGLNLGPWGAFHKVRHAIFGQFCPPTPVTLCHTSRDPPKSTSHILDPSPDFSRPSTKNQAKPPVQILSRGICPGAFVRWSFV